jgi:6-phosphogluconate dehydrogenase
MRLFLTVLLLAIACTRADATPLDDYIRCTSPINQRFSDAMDQAAILYPRFGVAWQEQKSTWQEQMNTAIRSGTPIPDFSSVHQRFIDRMLRTAESEAIQFYNLMQMQTDRAVAGCGPLPQGDSK